MAHLPHYRWEILVNNIFKRSSCSLLALIFFISGVANPAQAATETNLCGDKGVAFVFFNGVQTTRDQAYYAIQELKRIHGERSTNGDAIRLFKN